MMPLVPGDVVGTGTPAGVGMGRTPQRWLGRDDVVVETGRGRQFAQSGPGRTLGDPIRSAALQPRHSKRRAHIHAFRGGQRADSQQKLPPLDYSLHQC